MLKSLLSLALLAPLALAAPQDPAQLVPADTLMFFGTDSVKAGSVAARKTAMARVFDEAEVRAFLHQPVSTAEGILEALIAQAQAESGADALVSDLGEEGLDISLYPGASEEPLPLGRALFALTHLELPLGAAGSPPTPDVGLLMAVELLDADHVEQVRQLWERVPGEPQLGEYKGVQIHARFLGPGAPPVSLAFLDGLAVLSTSDRSLHGLIDRSQGGAEGSSLADSADYRALLKAAGGQRPGDSTYMVRVPPLAELAKTGLAIGLSQAAAEGNQELAQRMPQILGLYDRLGLSALQLVGGSSRVGEDGRVLATAVARVDTGASGLVASMMAGGGSLDTSVFDGVPADVLGASAVALGDELAQLWDFGMEVGRTLAPDDFPEVEATISEALGGRSMRDDLLGNLTDHALSMSVPGQGFPGTPNTIARMGLERPDDFVAAVTNLMDFVSQKLAENNVSVALEKSEHAGGAFYELDLTKTPMAAAGMSPSFAVTDGGVVVSDNAARLRGYLEGSMAEGPRLLDNERFKSFAQRLAGQGELTNLAYANTPKNFSTMYSQLSPMLPMLPAMLGGAQVPVDFSKLPRERTITQHLDISLAGGYRTSDGLLVTRSESSFSMLELVPLGVVAGLIALGEAQGIEPETDEPEVDPVQVATDDLRELKASITVYKIGTGEYPSSLDDLVRPLPDFPDGAYTGDELPVDPWGNPYRFSMEPNPRKNGRVLPKLWSVGPDGEDDGGEDDDVLVPGWR